MQLGFAYSTLLAPHNAFRLSLITSLILGYFTHKKTYSVEKLDYILIICS